MATLTFRRIRPTPADTYLANPHKGLCTYQRFNGDPIVPGCTWCDRGPDVFDVHPGLNDDELYAARLTRGEAGIAEGYLPSTVSYCRWYWDQFEHEKGKINFAMIDQGLQLAAQRGQTLAVRLMPFGVENNEKMPPWYSSQYPMKLEGSKAKPYHTPNYESKEYFDLWMNVHRAFAEKYDGHPFLESVDLAWIGPWGEGAGECSREHCDKYAAAFKQIYKKTPLIALIEGHQCPAILAIGAGWRCDCFGDLRDPGDALNRKDLSFNHMFDAYPREVTIAGATDTWRTAPVHLETCHVPITWYNRGYDINFIMEQGWKYHATYFMPKSSVIPPAWRDEFIRFHKKLGYRFILRQAILNTSVKAGGNINFQTWIENVGVAPLYRGYPFALRLRQDSREEVVMVKETDTAKWLPGDVWLERNIPLPAGFRPGLLEVSAGIIDPQTKKPRVKFAVREQFADGWVDLGPIEILA